MCALVLDGFGGCWVDWVVEGDCPANATNAIFIDLEEHKVNKGFSSYYDLWPP